MTDDSRKQWAEWVNDLAGDYVEDWVGDMVAEHHLAEMKEVEDRAEAREKALRGAIERRDDAIKLLEEFLTENKLWIRFNVFCTNKRRPSEEE